MARRPEAARKVRTRRRSDFNPPSRVQLRDSEGVPLAQRRSQERATQPDGAERASLPDGQRLQKVLASAGFGSRRACEALITAGRVSVDGGVVTELGVRVQPETQVIHVDGRRVQLDDTKLTIALNKPRKVVSAMHDPQGRRTLSEFTSQYPQRLYHVGRLDYETEGLMLLTNDGELAHRLMHPSFEVSKTYVCTFTVPGSFPASILRKLKEGIELDDGIARVERAKLIAHHGDEAIVELAIHEGRNRIVRRMFEALGFELTALVRTRIGPVLLGSLAHGRTRPLTSKELGTLMAEVGL